jgi:hypothetical protein
MAFHLLAGPGVQAQPAAFEARGLEPPDTEGAGSDAPGTETAETETPGTDSEALDLRPETLDYEEGDRVPDGYRLELRPDLGMVNGGVAVLLLGLGGAVLVATMMEEPDGFAVGGLVVFGVAAGVPFIGVGSQPREVLVRQSLSVRPSVSSDRVGLALTGTLAE